MAGLLATAGPVLAHTGYHYTGAQSTARHDGVYGWIEVANAAVRANTNDFAVSRVMGKKLSSGTPNVWMEVGVAEVGWMPLSPAGYPRQWVYVYETVTAQWHFYDIVSPGGHVDVQIVKGSSCNIGDPSCTYYAQLWDHANG